MATTTTKNVSPFEQISRTSSIRSAMNHKDNIRSVSVIGHLGHGKTKLTESLVRSKKATSNTSSGIISSENKADVVTATADGGNDNDDNDGASSNDIHSRADVEGDEHGGITTKSTAFSILFDYNSNQKAKGEVLVEDLSTSKQETPPDGSSSVVVEIDNNQLSPPPDDGDDDDKANKTNNTHEIFETFSSSSSYLIHLIDSPGHADFSADVTTSLRVTDGALVIVDAIDGVCVHTETVLRQAISERVRPVLMVNKVDYALCELQLPAEELYQAFCRSIESMNRIVGTYRDEKMGSVKVDPAEGTVAFGSGLYSWAFTLKQFGKIYSAKFNVAEEKMMEKLWGDWYFDDSRNVWTTSNENGKYERAFCKFIITPIITLHNAVMNEKYKKVEKMLKAIGVKFTTTTTTTKMGEGGFLGMPLFQHIMQQWLPIGSTIHEMIVLHLPSPVVAQKYRVDSLYDGPISDKTAQAIRACDASDSAPLCMYISKMVPAYGANNAGKLYAFGRVFSGKIIAGQNVRIMGPNYVPGKKADLWVKNIQDVVIMMGKYTEPVTDVPAGNICAFVGVIDQYLSKSGTICTEEDAHCIKTMKFSSSPIIRCSLEPKNAADLPKMIEGMKRLSKSDPMVLCYTEDSGEHCIAGSGELHLKSCLQQLQDDLVRMAGGTELIVSDPLISFRETCTTKSSQICLAYSANKKHRFFMEAEPLEIELCDVIDKGDETTIEACRRHLADKFGWDVNTEYQKIWAFGPEGFGPNILVDTTNGANNLSEVQELAVPGFGWATQMGPLCEEPMRGNKFKIMDAFIHGPHLHSGSIHSGGIIGQIMPAVRRACFSSMLAADPSLLEPIYLCNITLPQDEMDNVCDILTRHRGQIVTDEQQPHRRRRQQHHHHHHRNSNTNMNMMTLSAYLPVLESFGFTSNLRFNTHSQAFLQYSFFDHWNLLPGSPYEEGTKVNEVICNIRQRKGLNSGVPVLSRYLDT